MSKKYIRVYKSIDVKEVKQNLLIYGDLSGSCAKCNKVDLKLDKLTCPSCKTEFKYITFRNLRMHMPKFFKLLEQNPELSVIDYDDYNKQLSASKAEDLFK